VVGLEIRGRVTDFVAEKLHALRHNSDGEQCMNAAVIKTNAMKTMTNYFQKQSVSPRSKFSHINHILSIA